MCRSALLVVVGMLADAELFVSPGAAWAAANWTVGWHTGIGGGQGPGPAGGAGRHAPPAPRRPAAGRSR